MFKLSDVRCISRVNFTPGTKIVSEIWLAGFVWEVDWFHLNPCFLIKGEMKLVPFFLSKQDTGIDQEITMYKWTVFLRHAGKAVWRTDEPGLVPENVIMNEYLLPNGIFIKRLTYNKDRSVAWIHVDTTKTKLSEFYNWDEALDMSSKPECWRSFYFFKDKNGADWWSPKGISCEADIQDLGNVAEVFEDILRTVT